MPVNVLAPKSIDIKAVEATTSRSWLSFRLSLEFRVARSELLYTVGMQLSNGQVIS